MENRSKIAIIGSGFVGASTAFAMSLNQMVNEMVLIDVNKEKSIGEAMDISHGLSFLGQMSVYGGDYSDCSNCDAIIITAGCNRKPGETRIDLAKKNVTIVKEIVGNVMKYYTRGVILVVSNPVDILTYKISQWSGLPDGRVFGTGTVLDSSRFRFLLSRKFNVDVEMFMAISLVSMVIHSCRFGARPTLPARISRNSSTIRLMALPMKLRMPLLMM